MTTALARNLSAPPAPAPAPADARHRAIWRMGLWTAWGLFLVLGAIGVYQRVTGGHLPAGYGSYVPWGLWIAVYFHGIGIAGGGFAVAAVGYVLNLPGFRHPAALRVAIVLAFAAVVPALMAVWFDLGHMDRASRILTSPNFTSMMAFNAWMYTAFLGLAALAWLVSYRKGSTWLKPLLILGTFLAIIIPSQSGAFFGVVDAKAYWHSPIMPLLFLASAMTSGAALLLLVRGLIGVASPAGAGDQDPAGFPAALGRLRGVVLIGLAIYFLLEFAEISIANWSPTSHSSELALVLFGPYWWVFWIVHLGLGGFVPVVLLARRSHAGWYVAALLLAVCFIATRLNVLVPGQAINELRGLQDAYHHPRLDYTYHATAMEYFVALFLVAVGMTIFYFGRGLSKRVAYRNVSRPEGSTP